MILLIFIWFVLLAAVLVVGASILSFARITAVSRPGDRFFLAAWTGLMALCVMSLIWALWAPLSPAALTALFVFCAVTIGSNRAVRAELGSLRRLLTLRRAAIGSVLVLLVAYAEVQPICDRDVIIYHLDNIHAWSRTGIVPGLGLIYSRYGFASSWFTIPALFNHGALTMRIAPAANGFIFLLMLGQLQMVATRILSRQGKAVDWFILAAFTLATTIPVFLNYAVSTSPDFMLILGNMIIAWAALMIYRRGPDSAAQPAAGGTLRQALLPVFMAACMFTVKMPAAPIVAAIGLACLVDRKFRLNAWIFSGLIVLAVILPFGAALTLLTGYPLYPNPWGLDLPWTMSADSYHLRHDNWGKSGSVEAPYLTWSWLVEWLQLSPDCVIGFILFVLSVAFLAWILLRCRKRMLEVLPCMLIGTVGIAFLLIKAPSVRFGWSYLSMIPCTMVYLYAGGLNRVVSRLRLDRLKGPIPDLLPLVWAVILVLAVSVGGKTDSEKRVRAAEKAGLIRLDHPNILFVPPIPPRILFDDITRTAEDYREHENDPVAYLGSPRPMFHPLIPPEGVRYLAPEKGIYGGFARDEGGEGR